MKEDLIAGVHNLTVDFETIDGTMKVLKELSVDIRREEVVGVVGETGCGKSIMAKTLLGILPIPPGHIKEGEIYFGGQNLLRIDKAKRELLKQKIAYVPQDPVAALNPLFSIGTLMVDMIIWNWSGNKLSRYLWNRRKKDLVKKAKNYSAELLEKVHIPTPKAILNYYPIQLSGGMRQRVLLAMALRGNPELLVGDEPTTALDATIQKRMVSLIQEKINEGGMSGLYITHNLGVARIICNRTYVMYAGTAVETAKTSELLDQPLHPYSRGLMNSIPRLTGKPFKGIYGQVPDYLSPPSGCRFHPRCDQRVAICSKETPKFFRIEEDRFVACWLYL